MSEGEHSQAAVKGKKGAHHGGHIPRPVFQSIHGLLLLPGRAAYLAEVACSDRNSPTTTGNVAPYTARGSYRNMIVRETALASAWSRPASSDSQAESNRSTRPGSYPVRAAAVASTPRTQEPPLRFIPGEAAPSNRTTAGQRHRRKERGTDERQDAQAKDQPPGVETRNGDLSGCGWIRRHRGPDEPFLPARPFLLRNEGSVSTPLHPP